MDNDNDKVKQKDWETTYIQKLEVTRVCVTAMNSSENDVNNPLGDQVAALDVVAELQGKSSRMWHSLFKS